MKQLISVSTITSSLWPWP